MLIEIHQVDAFADRVFRGNPAAVCPLEHWLDEATMQAIAAENNLSETAFVVREGERFRIRWFTPTAEVPLCGHATLATAWVLFHRRGVETDEIHFDSASGPLRVFRQGPRLALDFPVLPASSPGVEVHETAAALGSPPVETLGRPGMLVAIYARAEDVRALAPDLVALGRLDRVALVTAPGTGADDDVDFVSRFFAPSQGIPEDPVTGSAHCTLVPYWAGKLGKAALRARQVSARTGELWCELRGERVWIAGSVVPYLRGVIEI
jgi:predicted PhzF superfamily epimerase YddE/YHI9